MIALILWVIINFYLCIKKSQQAIIEKKKNVNLIVKCEKCGTEHNASMEEFFSTLLSKSKTIKLAVKVAGVGEKFERVNYFAKKFECPKCKKKTWSEIKNYNEVASNNNEIILPVILKYFIRMVIGGFIIFLLCDIFIK